jgi:type IV pilus assembly protein PilB
VQVKEQSGLNFAAALRSFLRQDPNIILVGEIRDFETGGNRRQGRAHRPPGAVHAPHQRAPSTVNRLMNMGIEPFLVGQLVHLICAQRLVRRVCATARNRIRCRRRAGPGGAFRRRTPPPSRR